MNERIIRAYAILEEENDTRFLSIMADGIPDALCSVEISRLSYSQIIPVVRDLIIDTQNVNVGIRIEISDEEIRQAIQGKKQYQ